MNYMNLEKLNDTLPSYRIEKIPERYNEVLLKKTKSTMK